MKGPLSLHIQRYVTLCCEYETRDAGLNFCTDEEWEEGLRAKLACASDLRREGPILVALILVGQPC